MRRILTLAFVLGLFVCMSPAGSAEEIALETDEQKVLYAVGQALARNIASLDFTAEEMAYISAGLHDGAAGVERVDMAVYGSMLDTTMRTRMTQLAQKEKEAGQAYCDEQAAEEGAEKLASGLVFKRIAEGDGASPGPADSVKVHYHGTLRDGSVFDSTRDKDPIQFALNGVIPCFSEGLQMMKVGGKAKLTCPSDIAYGDRGRPGSIRPGAALTFEVELVEVVGAAAPAPESPPVP